MAVMKLEEINISEALRYMGVRGEPDCATAAAVEKCEKMLLSALQPRFIYRDFLISDIDESSVTLSGCTIKFTGKDIVKHLTGCERAVLMCATLSAGADKLIRRCQTEDMLSGLCCDALASAAVEQVCDYAGEVIRDEFPEYFHTWRFSPGYGDLPIDLQKEFIRVLDAPRKIGLCASENFILTPRKSVTAVIGLSRTELPKIRRGCVTCMMGEHCEFRKRGSHCGF